MNCPNCKSSNIATEQGEDPAYNHCQDCQSVWEIGANATNLSLAHKYFSSMNYEVSVEGLLTMEAATAYAAKNHPHHYLHTLAWVRTEDFFWV